MASQCNGHSCAAAWQGSNLHDRLPPMLGAAMENFDKNIFHQNYCLCSML